MQSDSLAEGMSGAVLGITVHRMAARSELHANLMRAACLRAEFEPGQFIRPLTLPSPPRGRGIAEDAPPLVLQYRWPGILGIWRMHFDAADRTILLEPVFQTAGFIGPSALDHRPVDFFHCSFAKLLRQPAGSLAVPRIKEHSGNHAIQSVHHAKKNV